MANKISPGYKRSIKIIPIHWIFTGTNQHPDHPTPLLLEEKGPGDEVHRTIEQRATTDYYTPYTFSAKERDPETGYSYFGARYYDPNVSAWLSVDPLSDKYPSMSAFMYCAGNPVMLMDPDGLAWKPTTNEETGECTGYKWIAPSESYKSDGTLKDGLYEQAIFFSENKTFDSSSKYNMGSSTATVYKKDGTTETFQACTYPSSTTKYATVPAGTYEANYGMHNGSQSSYPALRMGKIELGKKNPAFSDGRTFATGINIHKPGKNNLTGMAGKSPISAGCLLIDRARWDDFIKLFSSSKGPISITVSRTMKSPSNFDVPKWFYQPLSPSTLPQDNTYVKPTLQPTLRQ